jgi:PEP-CTERM motif
MAFTACASQHCGFDANRAQFQRFSDLARGLLASTYRKLASGEMSIFEGDFMRTTALAWVAVIGLAGFGAQAAHAAVTCSIIPSWCPAGESGDQSNNKGDSHPRKSVPEPGTMMLLAAGVTAVGGAVWRRKRAKKD